MRVGCFAKYIDGDRVILAETKLSKKAICWSDSSSIVNEMCGSMELSVELKELTAFLLFIQKLLSIAFPHFRLYFRRVDGHLFDRLRLGAY